MPSWHRESAARDELTESLESGLSNFFGRRCRIQRLDRRLSDYHSSFAIEEINVQLDDGAHVPVIFKNLSSTALLDNARAARSASQYDEHREILVYQKLLSRWQLGTATPYAAVIDTERDRYWLFLEKVAGVELYQIGDWSLWKSVAQWLARFHSLAVAAVPVAAECHLHIWDRPRYWTLLQRAHSLVRSRDDIVCDVAAEFESVVAIYERVVDQLSRLPPTVIHGDFYASNVLVETGKGGDRVCPIDWETTGIGPGLIDLAALVAGRWTEAQRNDLAISYWESLGEPRAATFQSFPTFEAALLGCRLVLALDLLGRSSVWEPPSEHRQDWLLAAIALARQLRWQDGNKGGKVLEISD